MKANALLCIGLGVFVHAQQSMASDPLSFSEEAVARGINTTVPFMNAIQFGSGMALLDLDGDDDLDIVISGGDTGQVGDIYKIDVYENDGTGHFTDRSATANLSLNVVSGISAADYDNDGDQDLLIGGWDLPTKLYRNDGGFVFTDVSAAAGIVVSSFVMGSSWSDYDLDGDLDLYLPCRTGHEADQQPNYFFQNNGDGTFTDVAVALNVDAEGDPTLLSTFFDYDRDGDDDLYLGTDKGNGGFWKNRLYRNDGGVFTEITVAVNAEAYIDCMGIAVCDVNNDSFFDLYMTDTMRNQFLMQDEFGVYQDVTDSSGTTSGLVGWGTAFADFDNDSFADLYVCNILGANRLYRGTDVASWPMVDEAAASGTDTPGFTFCAAIGDVNNDGLLDILAGELDSTVNLYINQSPSASTNHMIRFKPVGDSVNSHCVGACVSVFANGKWQVVQERAGVNYKVAEGRTLQVGLGPDTQAAFVEVVIPGGSTRLFTGAPADRTWTLYEQSRIGDVNNDGNIDWLERAQAQASWTGPGVKIEPGVEIFDFDGDFDIDDEDIAAITPCPPDLNGDGGLNFLDVSFFLGNSVDYNGDTSFNFLDVSQFLQALGAGCP